MVANTCHPSTWGDRGRQITRSRVRDQPGLHGLCGWAVMKHGETPFPLKTQKLAGRGGGHL